MCKDAAATLLQHSGREYGFADEDESPRATQLHLLRKEELAGLLSNNIPAERHLAVFGKRAPVAKFRTKKFTAKVICNDVTLPQSNTFTNKPDKQHQRTVKILNEMELKWSAEQKELHKLKFMENLDKAKNQAQYTRKLYDKDIII